MLSAEPLRNTVTFSGLGEVPPAENTSDRASPNNSRSRKNLSSPLMALTRKRAPSGAVSSLSNRDCLPGLYSNWEAYPSLKETTERSIPPFVLIRLKSAGRSCSSISVWRPGPRWRTETYVADTPKMSSDTPAGSSPEWEKMNPHIIFAISVMFSNLLMNSILLPCLSFQFQIDTPVYSLPFPDRMRVCSITLGKLRRIS